MPWPRLIPLLLATVICARPAAAQARSPSPNWDASITVALQADHPTSPDVDGWGDEWSQAPAVSLNVARFHGRHIHVGLDATIGGEGERYVQFRPDVAGAPAFASYYGTEYRQSQMLGGVAGWQFGRNQWVHPYLRVGVGVNRARVATQIPRQSYVLPRSSATEPPAEIETTAARQLGPDTAFEVRGLLTAGVKFYVSERASIRTDLQTTFRDRIDQVLLRAGLGLDF